MSYQSLQSIKTTDMNGDVPKPRFGHTSAQISKTRAVLFGGAIGDTGR